MLLPGSPACCPWADYAPSRTQTGSFWLLRLRKRKEFGKDGHVKVTPETQGEHASRCSASLVLWVPIFVRTISSPQIASEEVKHQIAARMGSVMQRALQRLG
jgi:hypothetical protein